MKLPFRGRPLDDDEYDDEDEEFDPAPHHAGRVLDVTALPRPLGPPEAPAPAWLPPAGDTRNGPTRNGADDGFFPPGYDPLDGPPSTRTTRLAVPPPINPRRVDAPPPAPRSERILPAPAPLPASARVPSSPPGSLAPGSLSSDSLPSDSRSPGALPPVVPPPVRPGPPVRAVSPASGSMLTETQEGAEAVTAEEFSRQFERIQRVESGAEQRSAWAYLGLLSVLFVLVVGFGYGCSGRFTDSGPIAPADMLATAEPVRLVVKVQGDLITLGGDVPDQTSYDRLRQIASEVYGDGNVVNNLVINPATTFDDGSLRMIGQARNGDERPVSFKDDVLDAFDINERGYEVGFAATVLKPVLATVSINGPQVSLSGTLPDANAVSTLTAIAGEVWGSSAIDATGLATGEATWDDGQIKLAGTAVSTDPRVATFASLVAQRIGAQVQVETSGLAAGDAPAAIDTAQTTIETLLATSPIKFAPESAEIDATSDALLVQLAAALNQVPATAVELVGHTDSLGDDTKNQQLSEDRAKAVLQRLAELGVATERMTARGEGESNPLGDNATEAGRAQNRRIDFNLQGANGGAAATPATTPTTTG